MHYPVVNSCIKLTSFQLLYRKEFFVKSSSVFVPIFFGLATLCGITADMCMMVFLRNMKRASGYNSMFTVADPQRKLSNEFFMFHTWQNLIKTCKKIRGLPFLDMLNLFERPLHFYRPIIIAQVSFREI